MNTYPPELDRLMRLARKYPSSRPSAAVPAEPPPHGFATRVAAVWVAQPRSAPFIFDLERLSRWGAAAAVCACLVVAGLQRSPIKAEPADPFDFFGTTLERELPQP